MFADNTIYQGEPVLSTFFWLTVLSTFIFCRLKRVDKMVKSTKNILWIKLQIKGEIYRFIHGVRYGVLGRSSW